jgi:putative phosphonate metabolism protein
MDGFERYAVFAVPRGAFYRAGADWLGWDSETGRTVAQPDLSDLPASPQALTATPRRYGFHGTIKPPFRLAEGRDATALATATRAFCATQPRVSIPALAVRRLGRFIALVPTTPCAGLDALAGATVAALDAFRAPATEAELARRRTSGLTPRQEMLLTRWGYPFVMEDFRFHMTLTGKVPTDTGDAVRDALAAHFAPHLPAPLVVDSLCLMGEDPRGLFHLLHRYALTG